MTLQTFHAPSGIDREKRQDGYRIRKRQQECGGVCAEVPVDLLSRRRLPRRSRLINLVPDVTKKQPAEKTEDDLVRYKKTGDERNPEGRNPCRNRVGR